MRFYHCACASFQNDNKVMDLDRDCRASVPLDPVGQVGGEQVLGCGFR